MSELIINIVNKFILTCYRVLSIKLIENKFMNTHHIIEYCFQHHQENFWPHIYNYLRQFFANCE